MLNAKLDRTYRGMINHFFRTGANTHDSGKCSYYSDMYIDGAIRITPHRHELKLCIESYLLVQLIIADKVQI